MTKTKELLAVLDMPEEEQWEWALVNNHRKTYRESLSDLAFRLTPEGGEEWMDAKILVWEYRNPEEKQIEEYKFRKLNSANDWFMSSEATATDRVIAALIAKQEAKE